VKYYLLKDLDFDGLVISEFNTKEEAELAYNTMIGDDKKFSELYHINDQIKMALIEGTVIKNDNFTF